MIALVFFILGIFIFLCYLGYKLIFKDIIAIVIKSNDTVEEGIEKLNK